MPPAEDRVVEGLWNGSVTQDTYPSPEQYYNHVLEQYKLYVQSAEQVSSRRNLANTFFLTLHTFLLGTFGFLIDKAPALVVKPVVIAPLLAALALCLAWWMIVRSYRLLNSGKFKVIGEFETRLPASPYQRAEWKALGEGKDWRKYIPLTHVENWVPVVFALLYIWMVTVLLTSRYWIPFEYGVR